MKKTIKKYFSALDRRLGPAFVLALCLMLAVQPVMAANTYRDASSGFLKEQQFLTSAARTASGDTGSPIDVGAYVSGAIIINVTAVSGTSPTLVVNFQTCADSGTTKCVTHSSTSTLNATGLTLLKVNQFARYGRISYVIGGTTPSFTFEVYAAFKTQT